MRSLVTAIAVVSLAATVGVRDAGASGACTHRAVVQSVERFADDFGHRRLRATDAAWGSRREFAWYSTTGPGERVDPEARRRSSLRAYFRERMREREHLRITELRSFYDARRDIRHLNGRLIRRARDLPATGFRFKGALSCRTGRLIVWSMASGGP